MSAGLGYQMRLQLAIGRVVPFVGAGVSMSIRNPDGSLLFPSWTSLLLKAAKLLEDEGQPDEAAKLRDALSGSPPDYLGAAKLAQQQLRSGWINLLTRTFGRAYDRDFDEQLALPRLLWRLRSSLIITTNYDNVLTWASPDIRNTIKWVIESPAAMIDPLANLQHPTIWHLHGHVDHVTDLVLTPDGYNRLYSHELETNSKRYSAALHALRTLMANTTFLFVGFSLSDPYFVRELELVAEMFKGASRTHFVVIREAEREAFQSRFASIPVAPLVVSDYGAPVNELLSELVDVAENLTGIPSSVTTHRHGSTLRVSISGSLDIRSALASLKPFRLERLRP